MPCLHLEEKPQDFTNWLPLSSSSSPLTLVSHRSGYCQRTTSLIRHHCGPFHELLNEIWNSGLCSGTLQWINSNTEETEECEE
ncbi:uncharacterized [Tachysurus ichikawai]